MVTPGRLDLLIERSEINLKKKVSDGGPTYKRALVLSSPPDNTEILNPLCNVCKKEVDFWKKILPHSNCIIRISSLESAKQVTRLTACLVAHLHIWISQLETVLGSRQSLWGQCYSCRVAFKWRGSVQLLHNLCYCCVLAVYFGGIDGSILVACSHFPMGFSNNCDFFFL